MRKNRINQRTNKVRCTDTQEYMTDSYNSHGRKRNQVCPICGYNARYTIGVTHGGIVGSGRCPIHQIELIVKSPRFEIPRKGSKKFKIFLANIQQKYKPKK